MEGRSVQSATQTQTDVLTAQRNEALARCRKGHARRFTLYQNHSED
jgi:hypothetical protein